MKIELSRADLEQIILAHMKNEVTPYIEVKPCLDNWYLPVSVTLETQDAAQ